jgi:hypothetical protein
MGFRSMAILAALLLALLGYLYFFEESKRDLALAKSEGRRVLPVDEMALTRIVVQRQDTTMVFSKRGQNWHISEPIEADADKGAIGALAKSLKYLENEGEVLAATDLDSDRVNLEEFGLNAPEISIVLSYDYGRTDTLMWGDESPTGRFVYLKVSGGIGIVKVDSWTIGGVDKGLFTYRNKKAIRFDKNQVQRLEIEDKGKQFSVRREGTAWQIVAPVTEPADGTVLGRLINRLHTARLKRFPAHDDRSEMGLHRPQVRISVFEGEGTVNTLLIGDRSDEDKEPSFFASVGNAVFVVDSLLVRDVRKFVSDARIKLVFEFAPAGLDSISLAYGDSLVVCVKDTAGSDWFVHEPSLHIALSDAVQKLLREVLRLKAKRFVSESLDDPSRYGLDEPVFVAEFFRGTNLLQRLEVGQKSRKIYAVGYNRPQVVEIEARDLIKMKLDLLSVKPAIIDPDTIRLGIPARTGI